MHKTIILCLSIVVFSFEGSTKAVWAMIREDLDMPGPIDSIREKLFRSPKNQSGRRLKKAYDALQARNYVLARQKGTQLQKDPLFADYGYWIAASANRNLALQAYEKKKYREASALAEKSMSQEFSIELNYPYSSLLRDLPKDLSQAEVIAADSYAARQKWENAKPYYERAFQRLLTKNSLNRVQAETLERYGRGCSTKGDEFCQAWILKFSTLYPKSSSELKAVLRYFPNVLEKLKWARPITKATQVYKSPDADLTAFDSALGFYLNQKYKEAIIAFRQFLDDYPKSTFRFRARYWLAESIKQVKEPEKAKRLHEELSHDSPLTYYGLLASIASGKQLDSFIDGALPAASRSDPLMVPQELFHLKRAETLVVEGIHDLAGLELAEIRPRDALSSPFLMYLALLNSEARNFNSAFNILGNLVQRGYEGVASSYGLRMIFPTEYFELVQKHAARMQLDPILVLSLIKQESAFQVDANSSSGALGLMQLMPATANETSPEVSIADLTTPEANIQVGMKYLKKLLTKFNGNIVLALAGYNAGPYAAERWIRSAPQKRGMLEFVESIPYRETREYVSSIIRNYYWYSKKLGGEAPKNLAYFWNLYGPPEQRPSNGPTGLPSPLPLQSNSESKVHDIAVPDHVFLPFQAKNAGIPDR